MSSWDSPEANPLQDLYDVMNTINSIGLVFTLPNQDGVYKITTLGDPNGETSHGA